MRTLPSPTSERNAVAVNSLVTCFFVYRSFYGMRIKTSLTDDDEPAEPTPSASGDGHSAEDGPEVATRPAPQHVDQGRPKVPDVEAPEPVRTAELVESGTGDER